MNPRIHTQRNMQIFSEKFPDCRVDEEMKLTYEPSSAGNRRYLFASRLNSHRFLNPCFYHPNVAVHPMQTAVLLDCLRAFEASKPAGLYEDEDTLRQSALRLAMCFDPRQNRTEQGLRGNVLLLLQDIISNIDRALYIGKIEEFISAAAGFLCIRRNGSRVNPNAGYMGKTDEVFFFGREDIYGEDQPFCVVEYKHLGEDVDASQGRWFECSGDLLARVLQSSIGHDAPVGIAFT